MAKLELSVAVGDYDRTRALIDGSVAIDGVDPVYMTLVPEEIFFRAFRAAEFDICELSLSSYTIKTAQNNCPYIAVPAFVSRAFRHTAIYVRTDRVKKPEDLKGRKVGLPEYQLTANVWARAIPLLGASKAIYLALGILPDGTRDILGLWIENTEGAKFWMKVFSDLKVRGVQDILIAVTDGLKGMPEALGAVFPATTLQTCIVHLIRNSLDYASWKDRRGLAAALKPIYSATGAEAAQAELDAFEQGEWGQKFPTVVAAWRRAWDRVIPFFAFPPAVRKVIYTTNAIESVNARLRKIVKTRGHFPTDEAATKLLWLALRNITADWSRAAHDWKAAMNQFAILYEDRFTRNHL